MSTIPLDQSLRAMLDDRRGDWQEIASRSGVSHSWISQFVRGKIPNPGYATLTAVLATLQAMDPKLVN